MFSRDEIQRRIETALPGALVHVHDFAGDNDHFEVKVVSSAFEGKTLLERHRMVYSALGDAMRSDIHALSVRAETPHEAK